MIYSGFSQNSARRPLCWEIRGDSVVNKLVNISFGVRFLSFGWHPLICSPVLAKLIALHAFTRDGKYWFFFPFPSLCLFLILLRWTNKDTSLSHVLVYSTAKAFLCVVDWRGDTVPHFFMIPVLSFKSSVEFPVESLQWFIFYPYPALGPVVRMLKVMPQGRGSPAAHSWLRLPLIGNACAHAHVGEAHFENVYLRTCWGSPPFGVGVRAFFTFFPETSSWHCHCWHHVVWEILC